MSYQQPETPRGGGGGLGALPGAAPYLRDDARDSPLGLELCMSPAEFVAKWRPIELTEKSASHQHFLDLCELVEHPKPASLDPIGESFTFEKGVEKQVVGDAEDAHSGNPPRGLPPAGEAAAWGDEDHAGTDEEQKVGSQTPSNR